MGFGLVLWLRVWAGSWCWGRGATVGAPARLRGKARPRWDEATATAVRSKTGAREGRLAGGGPCGETDLAVRDEVALAAWGLAEDGGPSGWGFPAAVSTPPVAGAGLGGASLRRLGANVSSLEPKRGRLLWGRPESAEGEHGPSKPNVTLTRIGIRGPSTRIGIRGPSVDRSYNRFRVRQYLLERTCVDRWTRVHGERAGGRAFGDRRTQGTPHVYH